MSGMENGALAGRINYFNFARAQRRSITVHADTPDSGLTAIKIGDEPQLVLSWPEMEALAWALHQIMVENEDEACWVTEEYDR